MEFSRKNSQINIFMPRENPSHTEIFTEEFLRLDFHTISYLHLTGIFMHITGIFMQGITYVYINAKNLKTKILYEDIPAKILILKLLYFSILPCFII